MIPSPALLDKIGDRVRREVKAFAGEHTISILALAEPDRRRWDDRGLDHVPLCRDAAGAEGRSGGAAIVQAQECPRVFSAKNRGKVPAAQRRDLRLLY